jgi:hypothetical protein
VTRRAALLLPVLLWADERTDVLDAVEPLATALSNGDADDFMGRIPENCPNRRELGDNIRGLLAQAEITCSINFKRSEKGRAELDWYMQIKSRASQSILEQRKASVFVTLREHAVCTIEPVDFFKPAVIP